MKQKVYIDGITCDSCIQKITDLFQEKYGIGAIKIDKKTWLTEFEYSVFLTNNDIEELLSGTKYRLQSGTPSSLGDDEKVSLSTYTPLFILFAYILWLSLIWELFAWDFDVMRFMRHFMAWFFIAFSYFKLINIREFAMSYSMYDIVAKKWKPWGYIYALIELGLGISYLLNFTPILTNTVTFVVMSVSIIWVIQSVLDKKKIKCACLWAVFNLPMSTITIIEDALMIAMSGTMIILLII